MRLHSVKPPMTYHSVIIPKISISNTSKNISSKNRMQRCFLHIVLNLEVKLCLQCFWGWLCSYPYTETVSEARNRYQLSKTGLSEHVPPPSPSLSLSPSGERERERQTPQNTGRYNKTPYTGQKPGNILTSWYCGKVHNFVLQNVKVMLVTLRNVTAVASFAYTNYTKHNTLCKIKSVTFYFH